MEKELGNINKKEVSKGQLFKQKYGFSKTQKRLMDKEGLSIKTESVEYLRTKRKERRHEQADLRKDKHTTAKAKRKSSKK